MNRQIFLLSFFILSCLVSLSAQEKGMNWLEEVRLSDVKLVQNSEGQHIEKLEDSIIERSEALLTTLLKFNSPFFLRENGYGMVSSASVRGTGAAQTAVVWNGININSQFTGQTDFNTINTRVFDNISLRPGGGSVVYGSGAIGGSIHLNDEFNFDPGSRNSLQLGYGSFDTYQAAYNSKISTDATSLNIGVAGIRSQNDYEYLGSGQFNENGEFYNVSLNASLAQWVGDSNILKFYSNYYQGDRAFSGTLNLPSNSKFKDRNFRNLLEWKSFLGDFTSSLKLAFLNEEFKYFENRNSNDHSFGNASTGIVKYDLGYDLGNNRQVNFIVDFNHINGKGSGIADAKRRIGGFSLLYGQVVNNLGYEISLRQEVTDVYKSPLLFSAGANYRVSDLYKLRFQASRNFRIPSFNDLFWQSGGNINLKPETSLQAEMGNEFSFNSLEVKLTGYFMNIEDLIRWVPGEDGLWRPINTASVHNYGLEAFAKWQVRVANNPLELSSNYAFTRSIDRDTGKQLIYTPIHKLGLNAAYEIGRFDFWFQSLYNGGIYTSSDNEYKIQPYQLVNLGVAWQLSNKPQTRLQVQANNLFNEKYESMPGRLMPGRSFNTSLIIKI